MTEGALHGLRVVEYAQMVAGPYCGKLLADLGADVIKVEPPGQGDRARRRGPFAGRDTARQHSVLFLYLNTSKRSVTLDATKPTGRDLFHQLVRQADILIEDLPPEGLDALGLGPEALRSQNSRLIVTSVTPFGQTGPYRSYRAYAFQVFHAGGDGYLLPGKQGPFSQRAPVAAGTYLADYDTGLNAAMATLAAWYAREHTGQGQHIDVSGQEAAMSLTRQDLVRYPNEGVVEHRTTRALPAVVARCRDGYIDISLLDNRYWDILLDMMGNPAWAKDERFKDFLGREKHREEMMRRIEEWSITQSVHDLYQRGQARQMPVGIYNSPAEVLCSAHLRARGFFAEIAHPEAGALPYPSAPYKLSRTPWRARRPAPRLGEHNREVYCDLLGLSSTQTVKLYEAGVI
ncbi:MAG: CoA transferase [Chloroflexi bacterium]|nr:CoA transferase [Chloroflexota bacterium]